MGSRKYQRERKTGGKTQNASKGIFGYHLRWDAWATLALVFAFIVYQGYWCYGQTNELIDLFHARNTMEAFMDTVHVRDILDVDLPGDVVFKGGNAVELRVWNPSGMWTGRTVAYITLVEYRKRWYIYGIHPHQRFVLTQKR